MIRYFLDYLQVEKKYAANTIISYQKDLEDFLSFYLETEGSDNLLLVSKKNIKNFIIFLNEKKISKRSINRKLSSLRSFYKYLQKIGEIAVSPLESIASLKFHPAKQIPFSQEEINLVLNQNSLEDDLGIIIIETLYQTGIRKSELCNLLLENVNFITKEIKVIGKGNKERIIPISENLSNLLHSYLDKRNPLKDNEIYFFVNKKGKKIGEKFVYNIVNSYFSGVSSKQKKSPHILRHSFATHILDNGAEISKVKKIMGHSSLASTQVYTNANIEQLKKVFSKAHPRSKNNNKSN